jgi:H2-forming N5,N10-methylenetetrahydromethanopterin dehydrogenase-like enzyme
MTEEKRHEEKNEEGLTELISVQGEMNAQVIIGLLKSEGIEAMMRSHQTFSALPFTVDGMGAVRIMVRNEDLDKAKKILEEYNQDEDEDNPILRKTLTDWEPPDTSPH